MEDQNDPEAKIAEITSEIVDLLAPLGSEERRRATQAALTLLGESALQDPDPSKGSGGDDLGEISVLSQRAKTWISNHGLSSAQLDQVFHVHDEQVEVIASDVPGKGDKGKTINAYVLEGIRTLLASGQALFQDKLARKLCQDLGFYNSANHAVYLKGKGNLWAGSKEKGWQLTGPGLTHGAKLIKDITAKKDS